MQIYGRGCVAHINPFVWWYTLKPPFTVTKAAVSYMEEMEFAVVLRTALCVTFTEGTEKSRECSAGLLVEDGL